MIGAGASVPRRASLLARVRDHFLAPTGHEPGPGRLSPPTTPPGVALLCAGVNARAAGAALGLALAAGPRAGRHPSAAVCVWGGDADVVSPWLAPALPAARRLAAGLAARGHDARAGGRLVLVRLPEEPDEGAAAAARAMGVAGGSGAPAVLVVGGPRGPAFETLLADQDLVLVATRGDADPRLGALTVDGFSARGVPAIACRLAMTPLGRALAAGGFALAPSVRHALAPALKTLAAESDRGLGAPDRRRLA